MRYMVCVTFDASKTIEVEAKNPEDAKEKAMEEVVRPSICHQCSDEIEIGEALEAVDVWES